MSYKQYIALCICILFIAVSASVTESFILLPLLEVGGLWVKAAEILTFRLVTSFTTLPDLTSPWTYVKIAALVIFVYGCYVVLFRPLNRVRKLGDIGYIAEGAYSVKETANFVQKRRKVGSIPPPYPNGWFGLMESFYLKKGEAKTVSALGQNFAVFRAEDGSVHVLDAYCPHMGANLAVGGRVIGSCIECPFHAWRFRGDDGKCVHIPYTDRIPDVARVKAWPVREVSGWIFVWHHAEGVDPTWSIPEIDELESGSWIYRGRTEHHVSAHIEEIPENGADVVHLGHVHGPLIAAGADLRTMWNKRWTFAHHEWTAAWEQCQEPDGHIGILKLTHDLTVFGFVLPMLKLHLFARQIGPGIVYMEFDSMLGKGMFLQTVTPMAPLVQKVVHNIYASSWMPAILAKIYMLAESLQVERDVMIWNNKRYEGRPMFIKSKEDTLILRHRRWYSQFYSDKSPRMFQKENLSF